MRLRDINIYPDNLDPDWNDDREENENDHNWHFSHIPTRKEMNTKVSNCCGTPAKNEHDEDFCFCSRCHEYCEYITEDERERRESAYDNMKDDEREN